jgi:hypothetical protein
VYRCDGDGRPTFVEADAPTDDEVHALLQTLIARLMKMLTRRGVLVEDMGQTDLAEPDADGQEARTLIPLQAAAITYRIAFGPRAGQKVLTLRGAMPREAAARQPLCADIDGFSLHAAVRVEAHDRKRLEQFCRHITRPALSDERVQLNAAGQVELKLKTPWRDGTTHLVLRRGTNSPVDCLCQPRGPSSARARPARLTPLEFMQRLAALVPLWCRFGAALVPRWCRFGAALVPLWCRGRGCTSSGSTAFWHRTPSCGRWWYHRGHSRTRSQAPKPLRPPSARSRPLRHGRTASAGRGCSSAFWLRHNLSTS